MDIAPDTAASASHADSLVCIDQTLVKMEPSDEYDEANIIVIKQEVKSDDENEANDGEYYGYIDTSSLEEANDGLISGTEYHSEESGESHLQNSDRTQYVMICEDVKDNSGVLQLHLVNKKPIIRSFQTVANSIEDNRHNKLQTEARIKKNTMLLVEPDVERPFKCSECEEMFELRSHLVMHELGHERYNKYKTINYSQQALDATKQEPILYICKDCGASFEQKNHLLTHQAYHENDKNSKCFCRKSLRTTSDLCKCFIRECQSCHRKFFAAIKLGNWTACIKCFFLKDSNLKEVERDNELDPHYNYNMYRNVKTIDIKQNSIESIELTNVKKLCYSCGKMCSNVISAGASWLCYDCWNVKMKNRGIKRIKESYPQIRRKLKYMKTDCVYCLQLFPFKSLQHDHQCLHKSVYLKDENEFLQTQIENSGCTKIKVADDRIGQHFLLSSLDYSLESPVLVENSVHSKYTPRALKIPSKQLKRNFSLNMLSSKQPQNYSWNPYVNDGDGSDSDSDSGSGSGSDCEEDQVFEKTIGAEIDGDSSTTTVILCDKTGKLINLNSETAHLQQNENNISVHQ